MADISDIENSLVALIAGALIGSPYTPYSVATSTLNVGASPAQVRVYRGWPLANDLTGDMTAGITHVAVYSEPGMTRLTTRYQLAPRTVAQAPQTVSLAVQGGSVTVSGSGGPGQVVGIAVGSTGYSLRLQGGETPAGIAQKFAQAIPGASALGSVLTAPSSSLVARVGTDMTTATEFRRQAQCFKLMVWAPNPQARDVIGSAVSAAMAQTRALGLPDGSTTATPLYRGAWITDAEQRAGAWRRDERYEIEYSTSITSVAPPVLFVGININNTIDVGTFAPGGSN